MYKKRKLINENENKNENHSIKSYKKEKKREEIYDL